VLVGTVDSNQIVVSPQVGGRIAKLLVEEVHPSSREPDAVLLLRARGSRNERRHSTISSLRSKVSRDPIYAAFDEGLDLERCSECTGAPTIVRYNWRRLKLC